MKTEEIRKVGQAYLQVLEKKTLDPVDKSQLKGTHAARADGDIDNDGDEDSTDKYLHKRRKAIAKDMAKENKPHSSKGEGNDEKAVMNPKMKTEQNPKMKTEARWPILTRIQEKASSGTPPETMDSKMSPGAKAFVAMHGGNAGPEVEVDGHKAAESTIKNSAAAVKAAPGRPNDNKAGDKKMPGQMPAQPSI